MNLSSLYKQLKKRLRQKRRWLSLGFFIVAAAVGLLSLYVARHSETTGFGEESARTVAAGLRAGEQPEARLSVEQRQLLERIREAGGKRDVYMRKSFVCGEEQQLLGRMGPDEVTSLQGEHPQWTAELGADGSVTFTERIDDLSPACKDNAYFGLDKNGNLSLFEGPPEQEKVIRTFFQLNMGYLESSLPHDTVDQLKDGIRIFDMAEYNSVLSTFSDFAVEETEKVMMPAS
ncbi:BofC C-terminal domain-containing protein [Paenibacillus flagellatus]|uniref:Bypass of forespore C C-terminal domain-containing protein n=1 Tax=Paenibacillus flagellatus TaxID=2211139 RepID=A0A2V5K258_9BACL|nr:BofC C-terminal domain-containing protein [Paenibacillus flagellatus]PYI53305.1 hypothetical protein DLM86_16085 [Paenibacillus flagellatus]